MYGDRRESRLRRISVEISAQCALIVILRLDPRILARTYRINSSRFQWGNSMTPGEISTTQARGVMPDMAENQPVSKQSRCNSEMHAFVLQRISDVDTAKPLSVINLRDNARPNQPAKTKPDAGKIREWR